MNNKDQTSPDLTLSYLTSAESASNLSQSQVNVNQPRNVTLHSDFTRRAAGHAYDIPVWTNIVHSRCVRERVRAERIRSVSLFWVAPARQLFEAAQNWPY